MKLSILSNINVDLLSQQLSPRAEVYTSSGYGTWVQEIIDPGSGLYRFDPDIVFIILDAEELMRAKRDFNEKINDLENYKNILEEAAKNKPSILFFVSTMDFPGRQIRSLKEIKEEPRIESRWHEELLKLNRADNFYIFDLKRMIEENGRKTFYSSKLWYLSGMKYSMTALALIRAEVEKIIASFEGKQKKCLILDLDNTLWGGVIGEDGSQGIELAEFGEGARFKDFQQRIKEMKERGVILTIVSKNNWEDVAEVFQRHPHMVLKEEDFVSKKVNWNPKYQNIRELSAELNIGLDSFVFIDDSPMERASIRHQLPGVVVPDFPGDTSNLEAFIIKIYRDYFLNLQYTEEDQNKTEMYRQNLEKNQAMKDAASFEDFLKSLQIHIKIWRIREDDIRRASQLSQKTNQFNLTTRRYTEKDLHQFVQSGQYNVFIASVEDKFGDNGKTALVIVKIINDKLAELDTFLMSCRVMGKSVEDRIIDYIENKLTPSGIEELRTYYIPTAKNKPAAEFFDRLGYRVIDTDESGSKQYTLVLKEKPARKSYARLAEM